MPREGSWSGGKSENLFQKRGNVENQVYRNLEEDQLTLKEKGEKVVESVKNRRKNMEFDQKMEAYANDLLERFNNDSDNEELQEEVANQTYYDEGVLMAWIWEIEKEMKEAEQQKQ
jgi:hypothetical protein